MDDMMRENIGKRASLITLVVNILLMLSKALVGITSRSTAIIADAFNNGTDIFTAMAVFGGLRIAYRPPDEKHNYGHEKAEPIVSKIVALIVMFTGFSIGYSTLKEIIAGRREAPGLLAVVISGASIFVKYFLFKYTNGIGKKIGSPSIVADSYNHRSDVLASSAVLGGVVGSRLGLPILDPIAGLFVSVVIFRTGVMIYLDAINDLMDVAPDTKVINKIKKVVLNTNGVIQVSEIKARKYGPKYHIDLKICVDGRITVEEGHYIAASTKMNILKEFDIVKDVLIHVNPCYDTYTENKPGCSNCNIYKSI